jgi:hypothetical protein
MILIMFQLYFEVENIISNYKMFFFNSKWRFQLPTKIINNVELNPQHNWNLPTSVNFSINIEVTRF